MELEALTAVATTFRTALESVPKFDFNGMTSLGLCDFPTGCCGDTAELLAAYLSDEGFPGFFYAEGKNGGRDSALGHAWLELDGLIVDVTADQFNSRGYQLPKVVVSKHSSFHGGFVVDRKSWHLADFRLWQSSQNSQKIMVTANYQRILRQLKALSDRR